WRRTIVRRHHEVFGRIEYVRKFVEWNPAGPFAIARPTLFRNQPVPPCANGNVAWRVVPDMAVDVGVDEVLRRDCELTKGAGEIGPVAGLIQPEERVDGRVIVIERGPAKRERLEPGRLGGRFQGSIVCIDGIRNERTVRCAADL